MLAVLLESVLRASKAEEAHCSCATQATDNEAGAQAKPCGLCPKLRHSALLACLLQAGRSFGVTKLRSARLDWRSLGHNRTANIV